MRSNPFGDNDLQSDFLEMTSQIQDECLKNGDGLGEGNIIEGDVYDSGAGYLADVDGNAWPLMTHVDGDNQEDDYVSGDGP